MKANKDSMFWPSFLDLMVSMFFVMLVLFAVTFIAQQGQIQELLKSEAAKKAIEQIQESLKNLKIDGLSYDENYKRFRLTIDVKFLPNSDDINDIDEEQRTQLRRLGRDLHHFLDTLSNNKPFTYLFVVEGQAQRTQGFNEPERAKIGYELSYRRALALYNLWVSDGLDFNTLGPNGKKCELLLVGSGYYGKSRLATTSGDLMDNTMNRRFTIQITPKLDYLFEIKKETSN